MYARYFPLFSQCETPLYAELPLENLLDSAWVADRSCCRETSCSCCVSSDVKPTCISSSLLRTKRALRNSIRFSQCKDHRLGMRCTVVCLVYNLHSNTVTCWGNCSKHASYSVYLWQRSPRTYHMLLQPVAPAGGSQDAVSCHRR